MPHSVVVLVLAGLTVFAQMPEVRGQSEYPWVHYFDTPGCADHPSIHSAFPDSEGNVIVSTGDWVREYGWPPPAEHYTYREGGLYTVREGAKERLQAPENTYVRDGAADAQGRTWIMFAEARSYVYYPDVLRPQDRGRSSLAESGYGGDGRFPLFVSAEFDGGLGERRFATIEEGRLVEDTEVTDAIPASPEGMCSDPEGRIFVMSQQWDSGARTGYFLSWWEPSVPESTRVMDLWEIIPGSWLWGYPQFGTDGLAYLVIGLHADDPGSKYASALLSLNPETGEHELFDSTQCPLLNSEVKSFYVDALNIKWLGTEDGLVRFDGETWARWTTENSGLPYNLVQQIMYDGIDGVYYVISGEIDSGIPALFSTLSPAGEAIGAPFTLPIVADRRLQLSKMYRDARGVFWLCPYGETTVYSYDHVRVMQWEARDWMEMVETVHYVGSTASGRTFCVAGTYPASCVMIW